MKFKYDYLNNYLWKQEEEYSCQIDENQTFAASFGKGFILGNNSWIIFTLYARKIKILAQFTQTIYCEKEISITPWKSPKHCQIEFEFTEQDQVSEEKVFGAKKYVPDLG